MKCLKCGNDCSLQNELCTKCAEKKQNARAIVSQNCKKLIKLISQKDWLDYEGFEKFLAYTTNIITNGKIVLSFKHEKTKKAIDFIFGSLSLVFIGIIVVNIVQICNL